MSAAIYCWPACLGSSLFWRLFASGCTMATGSKSGQPWCSCGRTLLANLSPSLRENWKIWEFTCWSWTSENQAYWHFCVPCHNREWSHLPRPLVGNRYTKPPPMHFQNKVWAGIEKKVVGELYLTSALPERRSSEAVGQTRCGWRWGGTEAI